MNYYSFDYFVLCLGMQQKSTTRINKDKKEFNSLN